MSLVLLVALLAVGQVDDQAADAPFAIVATRATASHGEVTVSLGVERSRARLLRAAVIVTKSGVVPATLVRTRRVCEDLCPGDEDKGRVCHFEAILRTSGPVRDVVAVLPGKPDVRNVRALRVGPDEKIARPADWIDAEPPQGYRWMRFPDGIYLTREDLGRDFYAPPISLSECVARAVDTFTVLSCQTADLLYEGMRGIAASFADYSTQAAQPEIRFQLNGRDAVLMRFGLKDEIVIALLTKENGRWRITFRSADYSLLC